MRRTSFQLAVPLALLAASAVPARAAAPPPPSAVFVVDSVDETNDANTADALCRDSTGHCTLRAAIEQANALLGADRIEFAFPCQSRRSLCSPR